MKASATMSSVKTRDGLRPLEPTRRTIVALATRNKTLSGVLAERLVAERAALTVVCPFVDAGRFFRWLEENRADVLVLDGRWLHKLDASSGPNLRARWPDLRVLLLGDRACRALAEQVVRNRFQGFLLVNDAAETCVKAVRTVTRGEMWVPRALLVDLLFEHVHAARHGALETGADARLTRREIEVIEYLRRGFANKKIADALAIREDTVKKHLRNAYVKLGVHRRSEIIVHAAGDRFVNG